MGWRVDIPKIGAADGGGTYSAPNRPINIGCRIVVSIGCW